MSSPANTPRRRPAGLPADARWEPALPGFEQGALDAEGRRHGPYRSWSAEGVLHRACGYEHGVLHGASTTYHPDGSLSFSPGERSAHCVRLCFATAEDRLREGVRRIAEFIRGLS